jgi:hypothetical protein
MTELIANAPTWAIFAKAAAATGFADPVTGAPLTQGDITSGGSWFYNAAGQIFEPTGATAPDPFGNPQPVMAAVPGEWVRVRFNGDVSNLDALVSAWQAAGLTIYREYPDPLGWSADGVTPAPGYVGLIGCIA